MCDILVVSRFNEDTAWSNGIAGRVIIIDKSTGNIGRESLTYTQFVIENYRGDIGGEEVVCFAQGSIGGPQLKKKLLRHTDISKAINVSSLRHDRFTPLMPKYQRYSTFDKCGRPHDFLPCMQNISRSLNVDIPTGAYYGAYFATRMKYLRQTPLSTWWFIYNKHFDLKCRLPWIMERLWEEIIRHGANHLIGRKRYEHVTTKKTSCDRRSVHHTAYDSLKNKRNAPVS